MSEDIYKIPEEYLAYLDTDFIRQMLLVVLTYLSANGGSNNIEEWLAYSEGTVGYTEAFKHACLIENHPDLYIYYDGLKVQDSDSFDAELSERIIQYWNTLASGRKKRLIFEEICRENKILEERANLDE